MKFIALAAVASALTIRTQRGLTEAPANSTAAWDAYKNATAAVGAAEKVYLEALEEARTAEGELAREIKETQDQEVVVAEAHEAA